MKPSVFSGKELTNFNLVIESLELIVGSVLIFGSVPKIVDFLITEALLRFIPPSVHSVNIY